MPWECSSTASATAGRRFRRSSLLYHNRIRSPWRPRLTVSTEASTTPECSHQALAAAFEASKVLSSKKSTESNSTGCDRRRHEPQRKGRSCQFAEDHSSFSRVQTRQVHTVHRYYSRTGRHPSQQCSGRHRFESRRFDIGC